MEIRHIRQLPPEVIGQIAAGEVVERPAAAIKELVENSMDAGATAITVDIREGGMASFRVTDNGSGIRPEEIRLAFARHATSKIAAAQDLYGVRSLGFRGEALASIAAVSKVTCVSRTRGADSGVSLQNNGGEITDLRDAACPEGTAFTVKELFYNAPVRRKFLKKPAFETAAVSEVMARMILSHPEISFRFVADGKPVYFSAGDGKLESAVMSVYGMETLKLLTRIEGNMNGVLLSGFVGVGDAARGNRAHQHFFLNGRAMKSQALSAALESACRQRVTVGRFPMCILHLTMPFEAADVNVHPNKWEVRFQDEKAVRQAVETIIFDALEKTNEAPVIPPMFLNTDQNTPAPAKVTVTQPEPPKPPEAPAPKAETPAMPEKLQKRMAAFTEDGSVPVPFKPLPPKEENPVLRTYAPIRRPGGALHDSGTAVLPPRPTPPPPPVKTEQTEQPEVAARFEQVPLRLIGVAFNTYILLEYGDQLILCDQHAAHERLLYERFMRETASAPASQALLLPIAVSLSKAEYAVYLENREVLEQAGFDLTPFGEDTLQLRGVPIVLGQPQAAQNCLMEALDTLVSGSTAPVADRTSRVIQMACKHAVKGGEKVPMDGILQLIRDILEQRVTPTCPHGRPLMVQLTHTELDKRFRRIQN